MRLTLLGPLVCLSLVNLGKCIRQAPSVARTEPLQQAPSREKLPEKKVFGIETRRHCSKEPLESPEIIGGDLVQSGNKYPFLAWLGDEDGTGLAQFCGGTLISDRVVLTAAHCVSSEDSVNKKMYVRFKLADYGKEKGIERKVVNWQRHRQFDRVSMFYDLALLLLDEKIPANVVEPVTLSDGSKPFEKGGNKTVSGWGSTDDWCSQYDTLLREATFPMGGFAPQCQTGGSKSIGIAEDFNYTSQICAGQFAPADRMHYPGCGDSGGPLMAKTRGGLIQVGIVSWTYGLPYPDVFTRVSAYRGWIHDTAAQLERQGPKK
mmetsp:Transcript_12041/g.35200  ORF Transcript_12041/g.35200 Transcript_12041/m.35200 type:complete len:319 (+) Transcript_12041:77-1033(+)